MSISGHASRLPAVALAAARLRCRRSRVPGGRTGGVSRLAFGVPPRAGRLDGWTCACDWSGTAGMVGGFWTGRYD